MESSDGADAYPSLADTAGLFLNALFVESLETDIERLERINRTLRHVPAPAVGGGATALRSIPLFVLRPSCDLGALARDTLTRLPPFVQYLFRGLGVSSKSGLELLSYLAFDRAYTSKLLALGYADAMAQAGALVDFVAPPRDEPQAARG